MPQPAQRRLACAHCPARGRSICAVLSDDDLARIQASRLSDRVLAPGERAFEQDDRPNCYHTVLSGWIALLIIDRTGARQVLDFAIPGDFFGYQPDRAAPIGYAAEALAPSRVCRLEKSALLHALPDRGRIPARLAQLVGCAEARAHDHLANVGLRAARERVCHFMVEMVLRTTGRLPATAGQRIGFPLTLGQMGDALALSPEHVSRVLGDLRRRGIMTLRGRILTVDDPRRLLAAAGIGEGLMLTLPPPAPARAAAA